MKVKHYLDVKASEELPGVAMRVVIGEDDGAPNFKMRVFEVEPGRSSPSHSHPWEHEVFVLSGKGVVVGEKGEIPIANGSVAFVSPDEKHCFINNGSEILRFICVIPIVD